MAAAVLEHLSAGNIFDLSGVVAVVTGGGTGIGLMISSTLVANGATVYIVGPKQSDLDLVAKTYSDASEKASKKGRMYGIEGDVRVKSEAKRIAETIGARSPYGVTVLFNNAGIMAGSSPNPTEPTAASFLAAHWDPVTQEDFNNVLNTNAVGPYWFTLAFLPQLERWKNSAAQNPAAQKFVPQVVMTSSMNGWTKDSNTGGRSYPYLYSKSAIGHATSSLAHELLPLGIRVNGIAPGLFATPMAFPNGQRDDTGNWIADDKKQISFEVPAGLQGGSNRDMGATALLLVANHYINGETILVDGGTLLKHPSSY